jgi:hypothetical protein
MQTLQVLDNASKSDDQHIRKSFEEDIHVEINEETDVLELESHPTDEIPVRRASRTTTISDNYMAQPAHTTMPEYGIQVDEDKNMVSDEPRQLRPRRVCVALKDFLPQPVRVDLAERVEIRAKGNKRNRVHWRTPTNQYGIYRVYIAPPIELCPSTNQDLLQGSSASLDEPAMMSALSLALLPFPNMSQFLWTRWFLGNPQGGMSAQHSDRFTRDVVTNPRFNSDDLQGMKLGDIQDALVRWNHSPCEPNRGWKSVSVTIDVPLGKPKKGTDHPLSMPFTVSNLQIRSIVEILKNVLTHDSNTRDFIWIPYKEYQCDLATGEKRTRIYNEAMSGDEVHRLWNEVQRREAPVGCTLPRLVLFLRFWSDATHLVQFGEHKLWPFYLCLANQPKWLCADPHMGAWHDFAYLPLVCVFCLYQKTNTQKGQLPKTFASSVKNIRGRGPSKDLIGHCNRELYHAAMEAILDDDFVDACVNGISIKFADGVIRRVYLRILTHSADYKEK